jgi:hypothetical protein
MANLTAVLKNLQRERARLAAQLEHVTKAIAALGVRSSRRLSRGARNRIADAQKARWAKWRKAHTKG